MHSNAEGWRPVVKIDTAPENRQTIHGTSHSWIGLGTLKVKKKKGREREGSEMNPFVGLATFSP